jgi:hypothetical protein
VGAERTDVQVTGELYTGEVALVLARISELLGLPRRAAQERGANPAPLEQDGNRGTERPGPDDGGTAWMLAGVADGGRR